MWVPPTGEHLVWENRRQGRDGTGNEILVVWVWWGCSRRGYCWASAAPQAWADCNLGSVSGVWAHPSRHLATRGTQDRHPPTQPTLDHSSTPLREDLPPKKCFLSGIALITPPPISGNFLPLFWTSKTTFCAYDRKIPMMIMTVAMIKWPKTYKYKEFWVIISQF